eukprot:752174-Pelagomonas_calceolata.AAC.1
MNSASFNRNLSGVSPIGKSDQGGGIFIEVLNGVYGIRWGSQAHDDILKLVSCIFLVAEASLRTIKDRFSIFIKCAGDEAGPEFVECVRNSCWSVGGKGEACGPHNDKKLVYSFLDLRREHPQELIGNAIGPWGSVVAQRLYVFAEDTFVKDL